MTNLPTLRQLRYLDALERERHFGRAAAACLVGQSTLSAGIQELEQQLGLTLVDRSRRRLLLTPAGEATVVRARRVLAEAEALVEAAAAAAEPLTGRLRLGVIPTVAPFLLPDALPALRRRWPRLRLYLTEDMTERLVEALHAGRLDLVLLALPCACGPVEAEVLFDDDFRLTCPAGHPLAAADRVEADAIDPEALLLLADGHCLREHALTVCALGLERRPHEFAATSLHTLVQMVDGGLGVTLLPDLALRHGILDGTGLVSRPLAGGRPGRRIALAWRKGAARRDEFRMLADFLRGQAGHNPAEPLDSAAPLD